MAVDPQDFLKPSFIIGLIKKWRWLIIVPLFATIAVGIILAIKLPKVYEASTLILVQSQKVPTAYVRSLITDDIDERMSSLQHQILSRSNLEKIIHNLNLYESGEKTGMFMEDKINALRKNIQVRTTRSPGRRGETNSLRISHRGENPKMVMQVTNALASGFIDENLKVREAAAIGTSDFLDSELNIMRTRLEKKEKEIEIFRTRYMGELPEQLETNLRILDRLQEQLISSQENLRSALGRLAIAQNQASTGLLQAGAPSGAATAEPNPLDINALKTELARIQSRYTERHPDVVKLKKRIKDLEQSDGASSSTAAAASLPREPFQVTELRNEIQYIRNTIERTSADIRRHEKLVESTPKREQELQALKRDYEDLQTSYSSLLNRKLEAEIALNMEMKQKGEQFQIIDRARLPARPIRPNMPQLLLMTIAAGCGLGCGLIFLAEFILNNSFRSPKDVDEILQLPTLTVIPFIESKRDRILGIVNNAGTFISISATCVLFAIFASITLLGVESTKKFIQAGKSALF